MRIEKKTLNDALRVLGKVVCQTSPVERQTTDPVTNPALAGAGSRGRREPPAKEPFHPHPPTTAYGRQELPAKEKNWNYSFSLKK